MAESNFSHPATPMDAQTQQLAALMQQMQILMETIQNLQQQQQQVVEEPSAQPMPSRCSNHSSRRFSSPSLE